MAIDDTSEGARRAFYELVRRPLRILAWVGVFGHLGFYLLLSFGLGYRESLSGRIICSVTCLIATRLPLHTPWNRWHIAFYELMLQLIFPFVFTYMALLNAVNSYWFASMVFSGLLLALLGRPRYVLAGYLLTSGLASLLFIVTGGQKAVLVASLQAHLATYFLIICSSIVTNHFIKNHLAIRVLQKRDEPKNLFMNAFMQMAVTLARVETSSDVYGFALRSMARLFADAAIVLIVEESGRKLLAYCEAANVDDETFEVLQACQHSYTFFAAEHKTEDEASPIACGPLDISVNDQKNWLLIGGDISCAGQLSSCRRSIKIFMRGHFDREQRRALAIFGEQLLGISRTHMQAEEIERSAHLDPLTRTYNRRYFDKVFAKLTSATVVEQSPISLIACDINGLKRINDRYGHEAGDHMIRVVAKAISDSCRQTDYVFRMGGDEFILLCPATNDEQTLPLLRRLRQNVAAVQISYKPLGSNQPTVERAAAAIGVASSANTPLDQLMAEADKRMFEDKQSFYKVHDRYR
jgi:diguanylate cyclase (GGDEF)-like protein